MATNFVWDKCHWFRSQVADSTLDDPDIITVCKQFPQQNSEVILSCQNNDTLPGGGAAEAAAQQPEIKSTHLSGGSAKDKQSCSLHISEIDAAVDNGFWNVAVSVHSTSPNATTMDYASFQIVTNQQNDLTLATTNSSNPGPSSIISINAAQWNI